MDAPSAPAAPATPDPRKEYQKRLEGFRSQQTLLQRRLALFGNARFSLFFVGCAVLGLTIGLRLASPLWLILVGLAFFYLSLRFQQAARRNQLAGRAIRFYEFGLARMDDRWAGEGVAGTKYLEPSHLYAADLDIFGPGSLFERVCDARTRIGRDTLARWLSGPATLEEVRARQTAIRDLRDRLSWREQLALLGAEVPDGIDTEALSAWGERSAHRPMPWARWLAPCLLGLTLFALFAWAEAWANWLVILAALLLQGGFALLLRPRVRHALEGLEGRSSDLFHLAGLLTRIEREKFESPKLLQLQESLRVAGMPPSKRLTQLVRLVEMLDSRHNNIFAVLAPLVLWTTQIALAVEEWRWQTGPALKRWLSVIGDIEALTSLAGYAFENPADPFPEIVPAGPCFEATGLGHPLLPRRSCVANDLRLVEPCRLLVVSGSNMSGKSTLLRTVGINAVLALAGGPVRAVSLRLSPLNIGATLRIQDSLQAGYSRFYAEITRLRHLTELAQGPLPLLFLLDEILHGTNSHDRRIGAEAVLRSLLKHPSIGIVTTHDLALTQIAEDLAPLAANVHFADQLVNGALHFDYRLQPGVVEHSNALALMEVIGLIGGMS